MIRVRTFLQYARMQLQEAEAALQEDRTEQAIQLCEQVAISLVKVLGAASPRTGTDLLAMDEPDLVRALAQLTETPQEARTLVSELSALRLGQEQGAAAAQRSTAEAVLTRAGQAFRQVHDLCLG
jgi:sRNA-binding protein